jgi:hypothetical protein
MTSDATKARTLRTMADAIDAFGLWTGNPNVADPHTEALDVAAAAYYAATHQVPTLFRVPFVQATEAAKHAIAAETTAWDTLLALVAHLELDPDDPIDRLAYWAAQPRHSPRYVTRTLRALAAELTAAHAA